MRRAGGRAGATQHLDERARVCVCACDGQMNVKIVVRTAVSALSGQGRAGGRAGGRVYL